MTPSEGLLLVDKPPGPTSHDVVAEVRRLLATPRVGHAGTLDPAASGLLPLALGRATRLLRFLPASPKAYEGEIRLGTTTDTDDLEGEETSRHAGPLPSPEEVARRAHSLVGRSLQRPPAYSARKVAGKRLYSLARRGVTVEAPSTPIEVFRFDLRATDDPGVYRFEAEVSSGTYVRALARDLGEGLGCGGALASLRRTAIGPMRVESAIAVPAPPETLRAALLPLAAMPIPHPALALDAEESRRFRAGAPVPRGEGSGPVRVLDPEGALAGIGAIEDGSLRPVVVLAVAEGTGL